MPPGPSTVIESKAGKTKIVWRKGRMIGEGAHGKVFLGFDAVSGKLIAAKEFSFEDMPNFEVKVQLLAQEIKIMKELRHENIVRYIGADRKGFLFYIFMEYIPGGTVRSILDEFGPFPEEIVRKYIVQVLLGLAYLHGQGIIHRDIKGSNLLVSVNGRVKLTDFGSAQYFDTAETTEMRGTAYWLAPEVIRGEGAQPASDIWSLGCLMLEMITAALPFRHIGNGAAVMVHNGDPNTLVQLPADLDITPAAREFMLACLNKVPSCRPTAAELMQMSFIVDFLPAIPDDVAVMSVTSGYSNYANESQPPPRPGASMVPPQLAANSYNTQNTNNTLSTNRTIFSTVQSSSSTEDQLGLGAGGTTTKKSTTSSSSKNGSFTDANAMQTTQDLHPSVQSGATFSTVSIGSWARPQTGGAFSVSTHCSVSQCSVLSDAQQQALINRAMSHVGPSQGTGGNHAGAAPLLPPEVSAALPRPRGPALSAGGSRSGHRVGNNPLGAGQGCGMDELDDGNETDDENLEECVIRAMQKQANISPSGADAVQCAAAAADEPDTFVIEVDQEFHRDSRSNSQVLDELPSGGMRAARVGFALIVLLAAAVIVLVVLMVAR